MSGKKKAKPQRTKMKTKNESLCIPAQERRVEDSWGLSHAERGVFLADPSAAVRQHTHYSTIAEGTRNSDI